MCRPVARRPRVVGMARRNVGHPAVELSGAGRVLLFFFPTGEYETPGRVDAPNSRSAGMVLEVVNNSSEQRLVTFELYWKGGVQVLVGRCDRCVTFEPGPENVWSRNGGLGHGLRTFRLFAAKTSRRPIYT